MIKIIRLFCLLTLLTSTLVGCRPASQTPTPSLPSIPSTATAGRPGGSSLYWPTQAWRSSTPEEQGMDASLLAQAAEMVKQDSISLFSLLVIRNGYIVSENYFQGAGAGRAPRNLFREQELYQHPGGDRHRPGPHQGSYANCNQLFPRAHLPE